MQHTLGIPYALELTGRICEDGSDGGESERSLDDILSSIVDDMDESELKAVEAGTWRSPLCAIRRRGSH